VPIKELQKVTPHRLVMYKILKLAKNPEGKMVKSSLVVLVNTRVLRWEFYMSFDDHSPD
jgi:hypothetical protein